MVGKFYFFFVLLILCFSSCQKMGCTDENAVNYDSNAKKKDGSCVYKATLGIWLNEAKAQEYASMGISTLTYFIDYKEKGTVSVTSFSTVVPPCDSSIVFQMDFDLGKEPTATYTLLVKRETGVVVDNYPVTIEGNKCNLFLLK